MACRVCGSGSLKTVFETNSCPKYSHKYLSEKELEKDVQVRLSVSKCLACGLVQLAEDFPEEEYSSDYQRNISFSGLAVEHVERFADLLAGKYGAKNFVEIGCGNGLFSSAMAKLGARVVAFEPSVAACKAAQAAGVDAHNMFFDRNTPEKFSGYDSFALRFVLEHVSNPVEILRNASSRCQEGAVGLIEVPNAEQQIKNKKWFEFFREHTLYFTPQTLLKTIYLAGLQLLELHSPMREEFLTVIVRNSAQPDFDWGQEKMKAQLLSLIEPGKKTWMWGASGAGVTLLCECGISHRLVPFIVDTDRNKWGLYASGSRMKIVPPSEVQSQPPDAIIILSSVYEDEIRKDIRSLGFAGRIGSIFPYPRWLEEKA
ncbi:TPA: class I SAM-dependent methyltransferase [Candidatus Micrarchaeota archaeon]|nr:class I SAM-dependent methyltransferase [Candidatus Micrarchaeota archaeon]